MNEVLKDKEVDRTGTAAIHYLLYVLQMKYDYEVLLNKLKRPVGNLKGMKLCVCCKSYIIRW